MKSDCLISERERILPETSRVVGTGIDIIRHERLERTFKQFRGVPDRIFTQGEQRLAALGNDGVIKYYSELFAAKEAVFKSLPEDIQTGLAFWRIVIVPGEGGHSVSIPGKDIQNLRFYLEISSDEIYARALCVCYTYR